MIKLMNQEKPNLEKRGLKGIRVIERELEKRGYKIIGQEPYQESINIEGQDVRIPFTNMGGMRVVVHKNPDNKWEYLMRGTGEGFESELRALHEGAD